MKIAVLIILGTVISTSTLALGIGNSGIGGIGDNPDFVGTTKSDTVEIENTDPSLLLDENTDGTARLQFKGSGLPATRGILLDICNDTLTCSNALHVRGDHTSITNFDITSTSATLNTFDIITSNDTGNGAGDLLILDGSGLVPLADIPDTLTGKDADTLDGKEFSDSCGTNFVRAGLNKCVWDSSVPGGSSVTPRDTCDSLSVSGLTGATYVKLKVTLWVRANNGVLSERYSTVIGYKDASCTTAISSVSSGVEEHTALTQDTVLLKTTHYLTVPVVSGDVYLRFEDDTGDRGLNNVSVIEYYD